MCFQERTERCSSLIVICSILLLQVFDKRQNRNYVMKIIWMLSHSQSAYYLQLPKIRYNSRLTLNLAISFECSFIVRLFVLALFSFLAKHGDRWCLFIEPYRAGNAHMFDMRMEMGVFAREPVRPEGLPFFNERMQVLPNDDHLRRAESELGFW
jgi:hypothetical protein